MWHYLENQFDNCTKNSNKRMSTLIKDHVDKLSAVPDDAVIVGLLTRTEPLQAEYASRYAEWLSAKAYYKGFTEKFTSEMNILESSLGRDWDVKIQNVYSKDTSEYTVLLPNGRAPFREGTYEQRIAACKALSTRLGDYPALQELQTTVTTFYTNLETYRKNQQQREEQLKDASVNLETSRAACALMMYRNLGILIDKYADAPVNVERFFQVDLLRQKRKDEENVEPIIP